MYITSDTGFKSLIGGDCTRKYKAIPDCQSLQGTVKRDGALINCLIDKKDEVEE